MADYIEDKVIALELLVQGVSASILIDNAKLNHKFFFFRQP